MRLIMTGIAILAAVVLMGVSAVLNYAFMATLARTADEAMLMGAAAVAGDLMKSCLPFFIVLAWRGGRRLFTVVAGAAFVVLSAVSLVAALGYAADVRGGTAHARDGLGRALAHADSEIDRLKRQRTMIAARPAAVIEQDIKRLEQDRLWSSSKGCTDATVPASRSFCADLIGLRAELASAHASTDTETVIARLTGEAADLRARGAGAETEPQVSIVAQLSGQDRSTVRTALTVLTALFIELGSGFGLYLAIHHSAPATTTRPAAALEPTQSAPMAHVERHALTRLEPAPANTLSRQDLIEDYCQWCHDAGERLLPVVVFEALFAELADAVGIRRTPAGYAGIARKPDRTCVTVAAIAPMLGSS